MINTSLACGLLNFIPSTKYLGCSYFILFYFFAEIQDVLIIQIYLVTLIFSVAGLCQRDLFPFSLSVIFDLEGPFWFVLLT